MKLRLQRDSLRIRLKQGEIADLARTGRVEDRVIFGPESALVYALEITDSPTLTARFENGTITVEIPRQPAGEWTDTDRVGLESQQDLPQGSLKLLLEKDFQCLHRAPKDDESDSYPHPRA